MRTKECPRCGKEYPEDSYVKKDKRRSNQYVSKICNACRRKQEAENRIVEDGPAKPPVVMALPHFVTKSPDDVWPRERVFGRGEFLDGVADGTWPVGLKVDDEKGRHWEVQMILKRLLK